MANPRWPNRDNAGADRRLFRDRRSFWRYSAVLRDRRLESSEISISQKLTRRNRLRFLVPIIPLEISCDLRYMKFQGD